MYHIKKVFVLYCYLFCRKNHYVCCRGHIKKHAVLCYLLKNILCPSITNKKYNIYLSLKNENLELNHTPVNICLICTAYKHITSI